MGKLITYLPEEIKEVEPKVKYNKYFIIFENRVAMTQIPEDKTLDEVRAIAKKYIENGTFLRASIREQSDPYSNESNCFCEEYYAQEQPALVPELPSDITAGKF